jgi:Domain of unknown function (DUF5134)
MAHPIGLAYSLAVVMVGVSVYCIFRLALASRLGRRNHYDVNLSHVLMGAGMVGMLVPRWNFVPVGLGEVVFGVMALYFLALSIRFMTSGRGITTNDHAHHVSHYPIHMVMACAMLYMYWLGMPITSPSSGGMSMSSAASGGDPALTLFLIAVLVASAIWQLDSIERFAHRSLAVGAAVGAASDGSSTGSSGLSAARSDDRPWLAPRLEIACHIAMCVSMAYLLVLMV